MSDEKTAVMSDEKTASTEVDEGIGNSNCGGIIPENRSSNHVVKMELDGEDTPVLVSEEVKVEDVEAEELEKSSEVGGVLKAEEGKGVEMGTGNQSLNVSVKLEVEGADTDVCAMDEVLVEVRGKQVEGGKLNDGGEVLVAEGEKGGDMGDQNQSLNNGVKMEMDGDYKGVGFMKKVAVKKKVEQLAGVELKGLSDDGKVMEGDGDKGGGVGVKIQESGNGFNLEEVDRENKDLVGTQETVEVKAESLEGGESKELSKNEEVLVAEADNGGEMGVGKMEKRCSKKVCAGMCKNLVKYGKDFCLKHQRLANKTKDIVSNGNFKVENEAEDVKKKVKCVEDGESSLMKEGVSSKRGRKRKTVGSESDGSEHVSGVNVNPGERTGLRERKRLSFNDEVNYGVDEVCAVKNGSMRKKNVNIHDKKVSKFAANMFILILYCWLDLLSQFALFLLSIM